MGKMKMGILGDFKGKIGTVVGQHWRAGKYTTRAYVKDVRNPRTSKQQLTRARFAALGQLATSFLPALDLGMERASLAKGMTPSNLFVKKN